jgi:hypothetical protein
MKSGIDQLRFHQHHVVGGVERGESSAHSFSENASVIEHVKLRAASGSSPDATSDCASMSRVALKTVVENGRLMCHEFRHEAWPPLCLINHTRISMELNRVSCPFGFSGNRFNGQLSPTVPGDLRKGRFWPRS